jgi:transposase
MVVPESMTVAPRPTESGVGGTIEIEFASGARLRITGAVDAATLKAAVAALADGPSR